MRIKIFLFTLYALLLLPCGCFGESDQKCTKNNGVVACYSGGRFGDNLLACSHALYFAIKNDYVFYFKPFLYSDQLILDDLKPHYTPDVEKKYKNKIVFSSNEVVIKREIKNTLFTMPYFPDSAIELDEMNSSFFEVDWDDETFKQELRALIKPKNRLSLINPPKNKISVAVHVRKGGSYGNESTLSSDITKLLRCGNLIFKIPVDDYYINQIKTIAKLYEGTPLYIFLFTDHENPSALLEIYKNAVALPSIQFDCRKEGNDHCYNVLEDFFSMMQFDILIRPESNFSIMAEKLGNFHTVISPGKFLENSVIHEGIITVKAQ